MKPINIMKKLNESNAVSLFDRVLSTAFDTATIGGDVDTSAVDKSTKDLYGMIADAGYEAPAWEELSSEEKSNIEKLARDFKQALKDEYREVYDESVVNEDNWSIEDKIDSIEIYGEDYQFSDTLEGLGYEYCLKLFDDMTGNNNLLIYKEVSGNEDFFVIDISSNGGTLYKVDHNGERLFLSENEAEVLSKRFNRD